MTETGGGGAAVVCAELDGDGGGDVYVARAGGYAQSADKRKTHVVVFFIFLVANIGGSLTPLGDPPLFLGFLHGVPFFWVTKALLLPMLLVLDPAENVTGVPYDVLHHTPDGRWLISLDQNLPDGVRLRPGQTTTARTVRVVAPGFEAVDFVSGISAVPAANVVSTSTTTYSCPGSSVQTRTRPSATEWVARWVPSGLKSTLLILLMT